MTDCVEQLSSPKDLIFSFWAGFLKEFNKLMVDENVKEKMTIFGNSLKHKNYFSHTRITFLRRELLSEKIH